LIATSTRLSAAAIILLASALFPSARLLASRMGKVYRVRRGK
jgi:hypothetical protein